MLFRLKYFHPSSHFYEILRTKVTEAKAFDVLDRDWKRLMHEAEDNVTYYPFTEQHAFKERLEVVNHYTLFQYLLPLCSCDGAIEPLFIAPCPYAHS